MNNKICSILFLILIGFSVPVPAQLKWACVDEQFGPLPPSMHVFSTSDSLGGKPNIAYYAIADLKDKSLQFLADTSRDRRLTPSAFYEKNGHPSLVVNCTFFSFETNRSLNAVVKDGQLVAFNQHTVNGRGKDTFTYRHALASAIGISKKRKADVAWIFADSSRRFPTAFEKDPKMVKDSNSHAGIYRFAPQFIHAPTHAKRYGIKENWKMETAVGGGPVLLQDGKIRVTNNEELKFTGKAIDDRHPRTAMGYTNDGKLIVLVIQGRFPGIAEGATLTQEAEIFRDLGCAEALNLDGGGSSCMLINGKPTIKVSDAAGQRPVPAVFIIK
jgi:hypothetical protein